MYILLFHGREYLMQKYCALHIPFMAVHALVCPRMLMPRPKSCKDAQQPLGSINYGRLQKSVDGCAILPLVEYSESR